MTLSSKQPVTVIRYGEGLESGLVNLLRSGHLQCFDANSGEEIPVLSQTSQNSGRSATKPSMATFNPNRADYVTFTTAKTPKEYEFYFEANRLQPGRRYTQQCNPWALGWWSHDSVEQCLQYFDIHGKLPPTESPPLPCKPLNHVSFECRQELPEPPRVEVLIAASFKMSLSGDPPLSFSTTFISHATKPVTVLAHRQHDIITNSDTEIIDPTTKRRVAPDLIDDGDVECPWQDEDFLTLIPEEPYREGRALTLKDGLDDLHSDNDYILRFPKAQWKWWSFDRKDEVMRYVGEQRLGDMAAIDLIGRDEVRFRVET